MNTARIELFIDRLCSFFPTTNIARNTLKSGWVHSEVMLAVTDDQARKVLDFCKGLPQFPSLAQIEHMMKKEMGYVSTKVGCPECNFNCWIEGATITWLDKTYNAVTRCECSTPSGRSLRVSGDSTSGLNGQAGNAGSRLNGTDIAVLF